MHKRRETPGVNPRGQGLIEYALIAVLVSVIVVSALNILGVDVGDMFADLGAVISGEQAGGIFDGGDAEPVTLFSDDFSTDQGFWNSIKQGFFNGKWKVKDGKLEARHLSLALLDEFSGEDFRLTVGSPTLNNFRGYYEGFGVMFRTESEERLNGYMFEVERVNRNDPGLMYFSQWVNGYQVVPPISSVPVPQDFNWENPGDFTIEVSGDTFTAYLDGEEILQGSDSLYTEGTVGVVTNYGTKAEIDSVTIESFP